MILARRSKTWRQAALVATVVAVLAVATMALGIPHHHHDFSNRDCPVCHITHIAIHPAPIPVEINRPDFEDWYTPAPESQSCGEPIFASASARAPPA
jgi:hypothetical protein